MEKEPGKDRVNLFVDVVFHGRFIQLVYISYQRLKKTANVKDTCSYNGMAWPLGADDDW